MQNRIDSYEKEALWENEKEQTQGLHVKYLIYTYVFLLAALFVCVPKIWLSSSIYYTSREINKLQTQRDLLKEENRRLQNEREKLRYQYLKLETQTH